MTNDKVQLAWRNLTHDPVRFVLFLLGVVFAVVLMFVQVGFRGALLDSQTLLHESLNADLVLVSPSRRAVVMREAFPRRRLAQAAGVPGVAAALPLYVDNGAGVLRDTAADPAERGQSRSVRVIGVDPDAGLLDLPELAPGSELAMKLHAPGAALYDRKSAADDAGRAGAKVFGPVSPDGPTETELSGRRVTLVGSVALGTDFTTEATLIVSADTFADILRRPVTAGPPLADVDIGLIRLAPGADPAAVKAALLAAFAGGADPDVDVLTVPDYVEREHTFWLRNTPIGFAFGFGLFMGFAVGLVICYQILSGDVADHLPEYATLKAVGYSNKYLAGVVLQEALILAGAGFVAGAAVSYGLYQVLEALTGMPLRFTPTRALLVFAATVAMCVASGLIALLRLVRADPADVFG